MSAPAPADGPAPPRVIAWEVTRSCNLACVHCRASAVHGPYHGELSTEEAFTLVDQIASFANPILILTGGDPLMRADIFDIAEYAIGKGLRTVMSPNGTLVTPEVAQRMHDVGIARVSISIDFPSAAEHDEFRGVPGAFDGAVRGIQNCLAAGVEVQINSTITKLNAHYLPDLLKLATDLGAVSFHPFMLVPTGRGKELEEQELPPDEYEKALEWMYDAQQESDLFMKPTDVPHYWRVMRQRAKAQGRKLEVHPHSHGGMNTLSRGCLAGIGFCFISHIGEVQGCGYFDKVAGDVRKQHLPRGLERLAAVQRAPRLRRPQGQVRRLRVQEGLRRLPRARLRGHRRLHGRGALLRLRAQGLVHPGRGHLTLRPRRGASDAPRSPARG